MTVLHIKKRRNVPILFCENEQCLRPIAYQRGRYFKIVGDYAFTCGENGQVECVGTCRVCGATYRIPDPYHHVPPIADKG